MKKNHSFRCILFIAGFFFSGHSIKAQTSVIGFYNCENFYDTTDQAKVSDEEFLPNSEKGYNSQIYHSKSQKIAEVIYALGKLKNQNGISLMGLVEIENKHVLSKVLMEPLIQKYHYRFVHFDTKDARGVDVALIYQPEKFIPYQYKPFSLTDSTHFTQYATRDILFIKGLLGKEKVHVLINHWPSRRGGEKASQPKRQWAATKCRMIMDSIKLMDPNAKWIVMGDFNDNPTDKSLRDLDLHNPFLSMFKNGEGTLAYNDAWSLFDQILISKDWYTPEWTKMGKTKQKNITTYYKPVIYKNYTMVEQKGRYKGYPKRTYNGNEYRGGYSDHFPVALILNEKNAKNELK